MNGTDKPSRSMKERMTHDLAIEQYEALRTAVEVAEEKITAGEREMFKDLDEFREFVVAVTGFTELQSTPNLRGFLNRTKRASDLVQPLIDGNARKVDAGDDELRVRLSRMEQQVAELMLEVEQLREGKARNGQLPLAG